MSRVFVLARFQFDSSLHTLTFPLVSKNNQSISHHFLAHRLVLDLRAPRSAPGFWTWLKIQDDPVTDCLIIFLKFSWELQTKTQEHLRFLCNDALSFFQPKCLISALKKVKFAWADFCTSTWENLRVWEDLFHFAKCLKFSFLNQIFGVKIQIKYRN